MNIPIVSPWIEETVSHSRNRIKTIDVISFLVIAVPAAESKVRVRISATGPFWL
jgi:hypothetical protein